MFCSGMRLIGLLFRGLIVRLSRDVKGGVSGLWC